MNFFFESVSFLWALPAVLLPVIIHFLYQIKKRKIYFPSIELLKEAKVHRLRLKRLKNILLLILRVLFLAFLVFFFSRPRVSLAPLPEKGRTRTVLVFVDDTLSMNYQEDGVAIHSAAKRTAIFITEKLGLTGKYEILHGFRTGIADIEWTAEYSRYENTSGVSFLAADSGSIFSAAGKYLSEKGRTGVLVFLTDLAKSGWISDIGKEPALRGAVIIDFSAEKPVNWTVSSLGVTEEGDRTDILISNFSSSGRTIPLKLFSNTVKIYETGQFVLPGTPARIRHKGIFDGFLKAEISGDLLEEDNIRYYHPVEKKKLRVCVIDGEKDIIPSASESHYLVRVLEALKNEFGMEYDVTVDLPQSGKNYDIIFSANFDINETNAVFFRNFVKKGGTVVFSAGKNLDDREYNGHLGDILPVRLLSISEEKNEGYKILPAQDTEVTAFLDENLKGRVTHRITRFFKSELYAGALVTPLVFISPDMSEVYPLVSERIFQGGGSVFFYASTFDPEWSNLHHKPLFPFLIRRFITRRTEGDSFIVTEIKPREKFSEIAAPNSEYAVFGSGNRKYLPENSGGKVTFTPETPDIFDVRRKERGAGWKTVRKIVCNTDVSESDLAKISSAELKKKLGGINFRLIRKDSVSNTLAGLIEAIEGKSIAGGMLALALFCLIAEMAILKRW